MPTKLLQGSYGLSKNKLEECNAQPGDVIAGRTFYSGDDNKKTGTLIDRGVETATSVTIHNNDLYYRIPYGAYRAHSGPEETEVKYPFRTMIQNVGYDRGQYQYTGGIGGGTDGGGEYIALNGIPEGFYFKDGADWAPEIRVNKNQVMNYIGTASMQSYLGTDLCGGYPWYGNMDGYFPIYLFCCWYWLGNNTGMNIAENGWWARGYNSQLPYGSYRIEGYFGGFQDTGFGQAGWAYINGVDYTTRPTNFPDHFRAVANNVSGKLEVYVGERGKDTNGYSPRGCCIVVMKKY